MHQRVQPRQIEKITQCKSCDMSDFVLCDRDMDPVVNCPGSDESFTVESYKNASGRNYSQLLFFLNYVGDQCMFAFRFHLCYLFSYFIGLSHSPFCTIMSTHNLTLFRLVAIVRDCIHMSAHRPESLNYCFAIVPCVF